MNNTIETTVVKKDKEILTLSIKRSRKGLRVSIRADEVMEEIFKEWGGEGALQMPQHGRYWEPLDGPLPGLYPLNILIDNGRVLQTPSGRMYDLTMTGLPLMDDRGVHLGFLRLKGISDVNGVSFVVKGVFSREVVRDTSQAIKECVQHFFLNFIKPIDVVVRMSTQEF